MERRQRELKQDRQSWRESLSFQPESLNGSGAAAPATFGGKIKEGFDKVAGCRRPQLRSESAALSSLQSSICSLKTGNLQLVIRVGTEAVPWSCRC